MTEWCVNSAVKKTRFKFQLFESEISSILLSKEHTGILSREFEVEEFEKIKGNESVRELKS